MNPAWVTAIIALCTVALGLIIWFFRSMWKLFNRTSDFFEDWNGREATPGHKRIPGAIERLAKLEENDTEQTRRIDEQGKVLDAIKGEVTMNGGGSMKDTVVQILSNLNNSK